jgi:hypothetical protein
MNTNLDGFTEAKHLLQNQASMQADRKLEIRMNTVKTRSKSILLKIGLLLIAFSFFKTFKLGTRTFSQ